jgi:YD repeat-containing protein
VKKLSSKKKTKILLTSMVVARWRHLTAFVALMYCASSHAAVGTTPGELSVGNGSAAYTIPIAVAPGVAGMVPDLSLQVSSPGGNGIAGLGGSISGLSAISRCPRTIAQDGVTAGVTHTNDDVFCLDGQRLIPVSGANGVHGTVYRTELDSLSKITSYNTHSGGGPVYFLVRTKSGQTLHYGHNADARLVLGNQSAVITWSLSLAADAAGNLISYQYNTDKSGGEHRPTSITYAGNQIKFNYATRPDSHVGYSMGNPLKMSQRLSDIEVIAAGSLVRRYQLAYANTGSEEASRLDTVALCDANGDCLNPVQFNWSENNQSWTGSGYDIDTYVQQTSAAIPWDKNNPRQFGDINGDGLLDIIGFTASGVTFNIGSTAVSGGFSSATSAYSSPYFKNTTSSTLTGSNGWGQRVDSNSTPYKYPRLVGDVNGDGRSDIVGIGGGKIYVGLSDGNNVAAPAVFLQQKPTYHCHLTPPYNPDEESCPDSHLMHTSTHSFFSVYDEEYDYESVFDAEDDELTLADVNGDGRADIIVFVHSGIWVAYSLGDAFTDFEKLGINHFGSNIKNSPRFVVDLNSDGRGDFLRFAYDGTYVALSTADGDFSDKGRVVADFGTDTYSNPSDYPRTLGDVNGDGVIDLIGFGKSSMQVALGRGDGTFELVSNLSFSSFSYNSGWRGSNHIRSVADMNGDGRSDLVGFKDDGVYVALAKPLTTSQVWNGSTEEPDLITVTSLFDSSKKESSHFGYNTNSGAWRVEDNPRMLIDVDANGSADIMGFSTSSKVKIAKNKFDGLPILLDSVTDGFALTTDIHYERMSDADVYVAAAPCNCYPTLNVQGGPQLLVSQIDSDNGQGGTLATRYRYGNMKVDLRGRGPLGFAWTETEQLTSGTLSRVEYSQQYPYTGMPLSAEQSVNGILVSSSDNTFATRNQWNSYKVQFPYVSQSIEKTYEDNGSLISTLTSQNQQLDAYGNFQKVIVTTTGGGKTFIQTTESNFFNDTGLWHLGRLASATVTHQGSYGYGAAATRSTSFEYDGNGLLKKEMVQPGDALALSTSYSYDSKGNRITVVSNGHGLSGRTSTSSYDSSGMFATSITNALGHTETRSYHRQLGVVNSLTGPNGLTTSWQYDTFGRKTRESRADGTITTWQRKLGYQCPQRHTATVWCLILNQTGMGQSSTQFDKLGRQIRTVSTGFDGTAVITDKEYDFLGREKRVSQPYFVGDTVHWTTSFYDDLNRVTRVETKGPKGNMVTISTDYNGLATTVTNPKGEQKTTTTDVMGRVIQVDEPLQASVTYTYDALGNLKTTTDAMGLVTTLHYNVRGFKTQMIDPAMGTWNYQYNAAGELTKQTDAKGQVVNLEYDALGRLKKRSEAEGVSQWFFDAGSKAKGELSSVTGPNGYARSHSFDAFGRPKTTTTTVDGIPLSVSTDYDHAGRVEKVHYPQDFSVVNAYNTHGYLESVSREGAKTLFRNNTRVTASSGISQTQSTINALQNSASSNIASANHYLATANDYETLANQAEAKQVPVAVGDILIFVPLPPTELIAQLRAAAAQLTAAADSLQQQANQWQLVATQLTQELANDNSMVYWQAKAKDAAGRLQQVTHGNGLTTTWRYDQASGVLDSIHTDHFFQQTRSLEYTYDNNSNVETRKDVTNGIYESFSYDSLDRLDSFSVSESSADINSTFHGNAYNKTVSYNYDKSGNITYQSGLGNYYYNAKKQLISTQHGEHRDVGGVSNDAYAYDANGNVRFGGGRTFTYSSYNKPT